jgi:hypothetical protein
MLGKEKWNQVGMPGVERDRCRTLKRFIGYECGVMFPEDVRHLRSMAAQFQRVIDDIIGFNY